MPRLAIAKPIAAFLDLIALSEGTSNSPVTHDDGYDVIVSGVDGPNNFSDYSTHPFATGRPAILVRAAAPAQLQTINPSTHRHDRPHSQTQRALLSTASGRYQIILPTWLHITRSWSSKLFSPPKQDQAALILLQECLALDCIENGNIDNAIAAACYTWASFPGNHYSQGGRTREWLLREYAKLLTDN